jgi:hypothetical protein
MWGMWFVYQGNRNLKQGVVSAMLGRREEIPRLLSLLDFGIFGQRF